MKLAIRSTWFSVCFATLGCAAPTALDLGEPTPAEPNEVRHDVGSDLIEVASTALIATEAVSGLWPGYWSRDEAFMLFTERDRAPVLLVNHADPPPVAEPVLPPAIPAELEGKLHLFPGTLDDLEERGIATRRFPMDGTAIRPYPVSPRVGLSENLATLFHEQFHVFQHGNFADYFQRTIANRPRVDPDVYSAEEFVTLAEVERLLLREALRSNSLESLQDRLLDYLSVRDKRTAGSEALQQVERHLEWIEGTAQLVGDQAVARAVGAPIELATEWLMEELARPFDQMPASDQPSIPLLRWRLYGIGAAIGRSLDLLDVDWRMAVQEGAYLDELLADAVDFDLERHYDRAAQVLGRYDLQAIAARYSFWLQ